MNPSAAIDDLIARILALPVTRERHLIAVVGPPASGKTTLAATLAEQLSERGRPAQVVPMDGFHLDNAKLDAMGLRARKGAPETFDAECFADLMKRVQSGGTVRYPTFDRTLDTTVADTGTIPEGTDIAIVEGNYLLLNEAPWTRLSEIWTLSVWLDIPEAELERRLVQRWVSHGLNGEDALRRTRENDLPNARRATATSRAADMTITAN